MKAIDYSISCVVYILLPLALIHSTTTVGVDDASNQTGGVAQ